MRYKLTIQYDGGGYSGWQKQKSGVKTIQAELEKAAGIITDESVCVEGSGRTDEGVHALGQVAHFDTQKVLGASAFRNALNFYLPEDIRITDVEVVDENFHARKSVTRKTYLYVMHKARVENPLLRHRAYHVGNVDVDLMQKECAAFVGTHDFSAFMSSGSSAKTFTRTVYNADITTEGDFIYFKITGSGFLYNMVRIIVGCLVKIGKTGKGNAADILESRDRLRAPDIAPAHGLYLYSVKYD